jgi:hypothetical protein
LASVFALSTARPVFFSKLAEAYLGTASMKSYAKTASASTPPVTRSPDESASSFVDRLINWYGPHAYAELMKRIEDVGGKSAQSLAKAFDQSLKVNSSIEQFRRTRETFDRQRKSCFDSVSRATLEGVSDALTQQADQCKCQPPPPRNPACPGSPRPPRRR